MNVNSDRVFDLSLYLAQCDVPRDVTSPDLLILNQPISDFAVFARLWSKSKYRLCADGGANRLYDMFSGDLEARRADYEPLLQCCQMLTTTRSQMLFMAISTRCAMMCAPTISLRGPKCRKILISIAQTSEKR